MGKYRFNDWEDEIVPYRTKRKKKKVKRSNHKHLYDKVIIQSQINGRPNYMLGKKCSICNKVEITQYFISIPTEIKSIVRLENSNLEIIKKYYPEYADKEICEL